MMNVPRGSTIDWDDARRRIAQLGTALNRTTTFSADQAAEILQARARRLAQVQTETGMGTCIEVMVMELAGEHYALETFLIREVIRDALVTKLPGTARHIAGIMNLRGRPLLVIDGCRLLGLPATDFGESGRVVVVGETSAQFGLLTGATEEVTTIDVDEIVAPPHSLSKAALPLLRGVAAQTDTHEAGGDLMIVLDAQRLLDDPRLWIDDQDE